MSTIKIPAVLVLLLLTCMSSFSQRNGKYYLLVGTYTSGKSDGIYVYNYNPAIVHQTLASTVKTSNPSYLAVAPGDQHVYAVNEDNPGTISSYSFDKKTGQLRFINKQPSLGAHPCYIAIDKSGKWVITGNYSSGTIAIHQVNKDGSLHQSLDSVQHFGSSVVEGRQDGPHVHAVVFSKDNRHLYAPDLGSDRVMIYRFKKESGKLEAAEIPFVITEAGAGPRHIDIHPSEKYAYLIEELTGSVSAYFINKDGSLDLIQNISCLPREYTGPVGSADIHVSPDGKFLYCSNRGESNTIGIFSINQQTGLLTWIGHQETLGKKPRNFIIDPAGDHLLVANQDSDEIVIFKVNRQTGLFTDTGKRISVPSPVCLKWITAD